MIKYSEVKRGDILKVVNSPVEGFAEPNDMVRVLSTAKFALIAQNVEGEEMEFSFDSGAANLEATQWSDNI